MHIIKADAGQLFLAKGIKKPGAPNAVCVFIIEGTGIALDVVKVNFPSFVEADVIGLSGFQPIVCFAFGFVLALASGSGGCEGLSFACASMEVLA